MNDTLRRPLGRLQAAQRESQGAPSPEALELGLLEQVVDIVVRDLHKRRIRVPLGHGSFAALVHAIEDLGEELGRFLDPQSDEAERRPVVEHDDEDTAATDQRDVKFVAGAFAEEDGELGLAE